MNILIKSQGCPISCHCHFCHVFIYSERTPLIPFVEDYGMPMPCHHQHTVNLHTNVLSRNMRENSYFLQHTLQTQEDFLLLRQRLTSKAPNGKEQSSFKYL